MVKKMNSPILYKLLIIMVAISLVPLLVIGFISVTETQKLGFSASEDDMGAAARLFEEFAKTNKAFELKAAAFDGKLYVGAEVSVIANLPNQEKALTMLASVLQAPISKLGRLLTALQEKNESEAA